jgi:positive regulator of sigma E activity
MEGPEAHCQDFFMTLIIPIICGCLYHNTMKPTVPETGMVLKTEGDTALLLLMGGGSCKGCGAAKMGLCSAGKGSMMVHAGNAIGAHAGDTVLVGIDETVRWKGYALAYLLPLFSLVVGSTAGYIAGEYFAIPFLDAVTGFSAFLATSTLTFLRLRRLDRTCRMAIKKVLSDGVFSVDIKSDEERRYEQYQVAGR